MAKSGLETGQLRMLDQRACWELTPGGQAQYRGPGVGGLRPGSVGRIAEVRGTGALMDFGRRGRWRVPHYFLAPPSKQGGLG